MAKFEKYFYAGIGGERVAPMRARAGEIHRQASVL